MAASECVRQHLESLIRDMTADLENSDGSKHILQQYRTRLAKENARLAELLEEEAQARRTAEAAQMDGVQAMWNKVQQTMADERESYSRLEESRKPLVSSTTKYMRIVFTCFPSLSNNVLLKLSWRIIAAKLTSLVDLRSSFRPNLPN